MAEQADVLLRWHARFLHGADAPALGNAQLRLDDVDAGYFLGDGVLHLDARIDLDEEEIAAVGIQQELHRAGVLVAGMAHQLQRLGADGGALLLVEVGGGGALHHLLVPPLHGAVALEQVHEVAVRIAEDLHLHVACPLDELLQVDLVVAEGV